MTTSGGTEQDNAGRDGDDGGRRENEPDERHVVTVFLRNAGEILLIRRSDRVGTYAGRWGAVSGYAEGDPDGAARWEIDEETGLADAVTLVRRGDPVRFTDDELDVRWVVHPFLFDCTERAVDPNEEVREAAWVPPTVMLRGETVPELWTAYDRVRPTVETVVEDTEHGSAWLALRALEVLRDEAGRRAAGSETDHEPAGVDDWDAVVETARELLDARPSMSALVNRVNRAMTDAGERTAAGVERAAHAGIGRALDADRAASAAAGDRVVGETVLTLSRSGTVERALTANPGAAHVYVAESRPAREGVGVAERLVREGVAATLVTDAAVAHVLSGALGRDVDRVVVGADTVLPDGSVLNKTGTRTMAIAATHESVPVEVVTATDKVATGETVEGESGPREAVYDGDTDLAVANPTFDRTPATVIDRFVTERGVLRTDQVRAVADELRALAAWRR
jgi:translation initiation factor 2B subunit (eIF-2B alpha/beta/delta family)